MIRMRGGLFIVGALLELLGIMLIAAPDLVPFARWISVRGRHNETRVRSALRLPGRPRTVYAEVAVLSATGLSAGFVVSRSRCTY